jgi:hypothetical protein
MTIATTAATVREVRLRKSIDVLSLISFMNVLHRQGWDPAPAEACIVVAVADTALPGSPSEHGTRGHRKSIQT